MNFKTLEQAHTESAVYYGDRGDWLVVYAKFPGSDIAFQSNFEVMRKLIIETAGEEAVQIESSSHWIVGSIDHLIISPDSVKARETATKCHVSMAEYFILDEDDYAEREIEADLEGDENEL